MNDSGFPTVMLLGGAPKCGTSAFFDLLKRTNCFQSSQPKETFFFVDRGYPLARESGNFQDHGIDAFTRFIPDFDLHGPPLLEGTTHLLYQSEVPQLIKAIDSRVVFILRDPADRIRSSFQYTLNNLGNVRTPISFADYVQLLCNDDQSELAEHFRESPSRWVLCNELYLSRYSIHVGRWNDALGKERVLLLDYEDIKSRPLECVRRVFDWAALDSRTLDRKDLRSERKNSTQGIRNTALHHFARRIGSKLPQSSIKRLVKRSYFQMQSKQVVWTPGDANALETLRDRFVSSEPTIRQLIAEQST